LVAQKHTPKEPLFLQKNKMGAMKSTPTAQKRTKKLIFGVLMSVSKALYC
jgi:hypothetical protein